jgi:hypothetical protein
MEVFWFDEVCLYVSVGVFIWYELSGGRRELTALHIFPPYVLSDKECCIIRMFMLPDTAWCWSKPHFSMIVLRYSVIMLGEVDFGTLVFPSICLTK